MTVIIVVLTVNTLVSSFLFSSKLLNCSAKKEFINTGGILEESDDDEDDEEGEEDSKRGKTGTKTASSLMEDKSNP